MMMTDLSIGLLAVACMAFLVSATVGLGGSLLLVPVMVVVLGAKQGVAVAALLLALNNVAKVCAYGSTIPWRASGGVLGLTVVGSFAGASLLAAAPERIVEIAVICGLVLSLVAEHLQPRVPARIDAGVLALGSGLTSGFSGTSGPLKGVALRRLQFDRAHLVGAAAIVSLAADVTKTTVFTSAGLLSASSLTLAIAAVPLMVGSTVVGRRLNVVIGERGYAVFFWAVMVGYGARLAF